MAQVRNGWHSERGAELIEFAVVMPILIFVLAGIFEFGMMFRALEAVTNAAREGARVGVLPGYEDPADVQTRVDQYLAASGLTGTHTVNSPITTVATGAGTFPARSVQVTYVYPFVVLSGFAPLFGGNFGSINLNAAAIMRMESAAAP
jgi:Flp pilus assembly protein TadG